MISPRLRTIFWAMSLTTVIARQILFDSSDDSSSRWTTFPHAITRVAVVGAGPAGLQAAAHLRAANLTVRLFERAPSPGGNWFYTEDTPTREGYPNGTAEKDEKVPKTLPARIFYEEGEDGIRLDDRWTEHWQPRPVWYDLHTNTPTTMTELPGVKYSPNTPWSVSVHDVQRHVRAYASLHGLNSNDPPIPPSSTPIASYSTRVESIKKCNHTSTWTLTMRRIERLQEPKRVRVDFWTEEFDAVVVSTGRYTTPYVPAIEGIGNWSKAVEHGMYSMYHSQSFRHPERYSGKTVLIVGASISATEIARAIVPFTDRLIASVRSNSVAQGRGLDILLSFPEKTEIVPEILSFEPLKGDDAGIRAGIIHLLNGTTLTGIDEIILATGYRSNTFLPDLVNPRTLSNLHWTGHYIDDPTLAYTSLGRPWTHGRYQSYGLAKVWTGTARLPNQKQMWQDYQARKYQFGIPLDVFPQEAQIRQFVAWLNAEALEFGGQFVDPLPVETRETFAYFVNAHWKQDWLMLENYTWFDNLPSSEWPKPWGSETEQVKDVLW
ncbi:FAD/NAD-P-binding domain-containing protein [Mycena maculata]|uniref:FAD/NAD-P-binding domain-containing protein n=1 Tax=Mycena maculata TaxID=230809 RepID=A0AAD7MTX1_9AGAR|nr:FAD/NAD-P-binding domain-containing protein [Mycena maculata]